MVEPDRHNGYTLLNSGKEDASSHNDRLTLSLGAHVLLLLHPNSRKVMILGLASGMTAGEALLSRPCGRRFHGIRATTMPVGSWGSLTIPGRWRFSRIMPRRIVDSGSHMPARAAPERLSRSFATL